MSSYIFIDSRVGDLATQLSGAGADSRIVLLDAAQDGLRQIAQTLEGIENLQSIHIVSHGAPGALYLGSSVVDGDNLTRYRSEWSAISASLADGGDILLYGCDVASGDAAKRFVEQLAALTGADVAASSDATGSALLGGNWELEVAVGVIETAALSAPNYAGLLAVITGDGNANNLPGTGDDDQITGLGGNDTIDGAGGRDTVIFSGASSGYTFGYSGANIVVTDIDPDNGDEGVDHLANVEVLQFGDGVIQIGVPGAIRLVGGNAAIATLSDGGSVVVSERLIPHPSRSFPITDLDVYAQRYDLTGFAQGEAFRVHGESMRNETNPAIAALSNGGFLVAWASPSDGSGSGVYAQRYDASGVAQGSQILVNTNTVNNQISPKTVALADGGFVLTWQSEAQDGDGQGVYAQRYDAAAVLQGGEFRVNTHTAGNQISPAIVALDNGGFVVTWDSFDQFSVASSSDVYAQRYDAQGMAVGSEFRVNSFTTDLQGNGAIVSLPDGGFVVTWDSSVNQVSLASGSDIYAQRYDAAGAAVGMEFKVNSITAETQFRPAVARLADGGFVVSWVNYSNDPIHGFTVDIHAQRYNAAGVEQGAEFSLPSFIGVEHTAVTALPDGGFVVAGSGAASVSGVNFHSQRYDAAGNVVGATLIGDGSNNTLRWTDAVGASMDGGAGDDTLVGGVGADTLDGGPGNDTVNYSGNLVGMIADLATGRASRSFGGGTLDNDRLIDIENLIGSGFRDDVNGNDSANLIFGGGGGDILDGLVGADTIYGGISEDTIDGGADNDILHGENGDDLIFGGTGNDVIYGGADGDTLIGESGNDLVYGGAWADAIDGRGGSDVLYGDAGPDIIWGDGFPADYGFANDSLFGGNENDMLLGEDATSSTLGAGDALHGEAGNDSLDGGGGNDTIYGGTGNDVIDGDHGNDLIYGGSGSETMLGSNAVNYGGPTQGSDLFVYLSLTDAGDSIYGFDTRPGENDGIDLRPLFDALGYTGTRPRSDGYLYVFQNVGNTDVYIDSDGAANGANLSPRLFTLVDTYAPALTDGYFLFQ